MEPGGVFTGGQNAYNCKQSHHTSCWGRGTHSCPDGHWAEERLGALLKTPHEQFEAIPAHKHLESTLTPVLAHGWLVHGRVHDVFWLDAGRPGRHLITCRTATTQMLSNSKKTSEIQLSLFSPVFALNFKILAMKWPKANQMKWKSKQRNTMTVSCWLPVKLLSTMSCWWHRNFCFPAVWMVY